MAHAVPNNIPKAQSQCNTRTRIPIIIALRLLTVPRGRSWRRLPLSLFPLTLQYAHRTSFHLGNNEQVKEAGWISAATMQWVGPPSSAAGLLPLPHSLPPITLHDNNPIWCPSRPCCRRLRLIDTQKGFSKLLPPHHIHNTISSEILPPPFPSLPSSQLDTRAANLKFELVNSRCNPGQVGSL